MRAISILALLLATTFARAAPPDPQLRASLDSPISATITWTADRRLCLSYNGAPDSCYAAGRWRVTFGHIGPLDGTLRPQAGGVYVLSDPATGATWRARLAYWRWLAVVRA